MEGFLDFFFEFITTLLGGFAKIFTGLFSGVVQIFNVVEYARIFVAHVPSFGILDWVLAVISVLMVVAALVLAVFGLILLIRKYVRFRKSVVGQEDILEEVANLHREVIRLTKEKDRIMAMQVSKLDPSYMLNYDENDYPVEAVWNLHNATVNANGVAGAIGEGTESAAPKAAVVQSRFVRLSESDRRYEFYTPPTYDDTIKLDELCERMRNFACSNMHLYYEIKIIRLAIAGLAATKMILLQGISGTGKTSLPYCMGKFFQKDATIASVQPSWRDKTELFGYFNEFTKKYNETDILRRIYEAGYDDDINIIILDEMNIARVEYYFAEMLSILEMPDENQWRVDLVPSEWEGDPKLLKDGKLQISPNIWYVGTANNDDSTFSVSDKVYDRAFTINLDSKGEQFFAEMTEPVTVSYGHLESLFNAAVEEHPVSEENLEKIARLDMYIIEKLRIAFGNRIMKQLRIFVPVFVACGGTELEAIDYLLATKIFRKFDSLNVAIIRDEIKGLSVFLTKLFGKGTMTECQNYLERLMKMF